MIPLIASRHPLWEERLDRGGKRSCLEEGYLLAEGREALGTTPLDAAPDVILKMPDDTSIPFLLALFGALGFAGLLLDWHRFTVLMAAAAGFALAAWMWPRKKTAQRIAGGESGQEAEYG